MLLLRAHGRRGPIVIDALESPRYLLWLDVVARGRALFVTGPLRTQGLSEFGNLHAYLRDVLSDDFGPLVEMISYRVHTPVIVHMLEGRLVLQLIKHPVVVCYLGVQTLQDPLLLCAPTIDPLLDIL